MERFNAGTIPRLGTSLYYRDDLPWEVSLFRAKDILEKGARADKISNDRSPITHTLLASVLERLDDPKGAEAELRRALEIDPHYEEAQYNLAMLLDDSRREEKIEIFRQSIAEDPDYFIALRDLGFELVKAKRLTEAGSYLAKALELGPEDVPLQWYLGQLKWMQEDISSAELHFRKAVELDPGNGASHTLLGRFCQYHDQAEEANREFFSAIELDSVDEGSVAAYVKFLAEFEDRDFAAKLYLTAKQNTLLSSESLAELESKLFPN
jgi:Flp pilus assembly protein TadD